MWSKFVSDVMPWLQLRFDYDTTTTYRARLLPIRRKQKMNMSIFRRSRIVVESQLWYRLNCHSHTSAFMLSRLDCCNAIPVGLSKSTIIAWLQRAQSVAGWSHVLPHMNDHVISALQEFGLRQLGSTTNFVYPCFSSASPVSCRQPSFSGLSTTFCTVFLSSFICHSV